MDAKSLLSAAARVLHPNAGQSVCVMELAQGTAAVAVRGNSSSSSSDNTRQNRVCKRPAECCDVLSLSLHNPKSCRNVQAGTPHCSACSCPRKGKVSFVVSVRDQNRHSLNVRPSLQNCLAELNSSPVTKPDFSPDSGSFGTRTGAVPESALGMSERIPSCMAGVGILCPHPTKEKSQPPAKCPNFFPCFPSTVNLTFAKESIL